MSRDICVCFTGGGTGGHVFPGLAVARALQDKHPHARILFCGTDRSQEREAVSTAGYAHAALPTVPPSQLRTKPVRFLRGNWQAWRRAKLLLSDWQPDVVIGLGGFASAPMALAASRRHIPLILLEQNVLPGRATRWFARRAACICTSFAATAGHLQPRVPTVVTGNPVRSEIAALATSNRAEPPFRRASRGSRHRPTLLVLGGSQGASAVNAAVLSAADVLQSQLQGWCIIHQTGPRESVTVTNHYEKRELEFRAESFFSEMADLYANATLAVCRAGATTLAELACAGCPAICIPYPHATDNHQLLNVQFYEQQGAAAMIQQRRDPTATAAQLVETLGKLIGDERSRLRMRQQMAATAHPDAAERVVDQIEISLS